MPADTRVQDFESAMRAVCEPVFERPISEISFGQLLVYLFQTAARFDMEIQPSLVLLQKTLLNIEGLGRQLYPELNLWDTAQPYLEDWVQERYSPQSVFRRLQSHAPSWLEQLPNLPDVVLESLQQAREQGPGKAAAARSAREAASRRKTQRRQLLAGLACIAGALIAIPGAGGYLAEVPVASWVLGAIGITLLWPRLD